MAEELPGTSLTGHHHITMGVGNVQEDFDFHTKVLGLKCVKRTLFYDGATPVYHIYYGNDTGDESTLLTTFPVAHIGVKAKEGSGQVSYVSLSVPESALPYWNKRLKDHGFDVAETERALADQRSRCSASSGTPLSSTSQMAVIGMRFAWRICLTRWSARNSLSPDLPPRSINFSAACVPPGPSAFQTSPKEPRPNSSIVR